MRLIIYGININLSNNQIGDKGAELLAYYLAKGDFLSLNSLNVSGNYITPTGEGYFAKALTDAKVTSISIILTVKSSLKEIANFIKTGFNYYAKEFNIKQLATDVETQKYVTDCQKTGMNIIVGIYGGLIKCTSSLPSVPKFAICLSKEIGTSLLEPETINCFIDINRFFEKDITALIGESSDQDIHHQDCTIF